VGYTTIGDPVPIYVELHEPRYQYQLANDPRLPPVSLKVVGSPAHIVPGDADADDASVDTVLLTFTVCDRHVVVLHIPSALIQ
jgi:hypothetical protein